MNTRPDHHMELQQGTLRTRIRRSPEHRQPALQESLRRLRNVFCWDGGDGLPEALDVDELPGLSRFQRLSHLGLLHAHRGRFGGRGSLCTWLPASLQVSAARKSAFYVLEAANSAQLPEPVCLYAVLSCPPALIHDCDFQRLCALLDLAA